MLQITTAQVAERYRKAVRTVNRQAKSGRLPFVQKLPGERGAYLFDPEEVERVLGQAPSEDEAA